MFLSQSLQKENETLALTSLNEWLLSPEYVLVNTFVIFATSLAICIGFTI